MSSVETADLHSMVDACVVQADRQQLLARDIPPLARRGVGDFFVYF
ncbi:MAG TPA: hypothetical protein VKR21_02225 [Solirubrobacteraceae bacterium]|nr:hypothetical protein [Solirubrobacteraceae bacterium]